MKIIKLHFKNAGGDVFHETRVKDEIADDLFQVWLKNAEHLKDTGEIIDFDISILTKEEV